MKKCLYVLHSLIKADGITELSLKLVKVDYESRLQFFKEDTFEIQYLEGKTQREMFN